MPRLLHVLLLPLVLAALALPRAAADVRKAPSRINLRVGCFNAWLIPLIATDRSDRLARMPAALRALKMDVLCLQEVWTAGDQRALAKALKKQFPHVLRGGGGLMLLSRHPIVQRTWKAFPHFKGLPLQEQLARKGILDAVLETPVGRVRVVTSHLALAFGKDNPRTKQLAFLLRRLAKQRDLPLILAADLNTWPVEHGRLTSDYKAVLRAGLTDAKPPQRSAQGRYDPGLPTRIGWPRPAIKPLRGYYYPDHVFFRATQAQTLRLGRFQLVLDEKRTALSDHNLLLADFTLGRSAPPAKAPR